MNRIANLISAGGDVDTFAAATTSTASLEPSVRDEELLDVLASNLCRCTGYQNIIKAVRAARDEMRKST